MSEGLQLGLACASIVLAFAFFQLLEWLEGRPARSQSKQDNGGREK